MYGFSVLFNTMVRHYFGLSVLRERLRRKEQLLNLFAPLLGAGALGAFFIYFYTRFMLSTYSVSVQLQQPGLILLFGLLTVQVIVLFFGFFYMVSVFYYSTDMEFLVPLPLQPRTILIAKFGIVLLTEYVTALPLALPPVIIYGINQGVSLLYWPAALGIILLLPLLPLALAGAFAVLLMRFTNLGRHRDTLRVISGIVSVFVAAWMQYYFSRLEVVDPNEMMMSIITMPNSLVQMLGRRFPPSLWGASALINSGTAALGYILLYIGTAAASLALLGFVGQRFFYSGLLTGNAHPSHKRVKQMAIGTALAVRSPLAALVAREWYNIVRNPIFAMTMGVNLLLPPVMMVLPLVVSGQQLINVDSLIGDPRFLVFGSIIVAGIYAFLTLISCIPATAVSREGQQFWISQILPIAPARQVWAKLLFAASVSAAAGLLWLFIAVVLFHLPWNIIVWGTLLGIPAMVLSSAISLCFDCLWPRLDWVNPQQAMKGNQNSLIATLTVGLAGFGIAWLIIRVTTLGWSPVAVFGFTFVVLTALAAAASLLMVNLANRLYTPFADTKGEGLVERLRAIPGQKIRPVITILVLLAVFGSMGVEFLKGRNLEYLLTEDAVVIGSTTIPYAEVTDVGYFERVPPLSNRVGTSIGNYSSGTFTVAGIGRGKVFATDVTQPAVVIYTAETFYVITPENAFEFYSRLLTLIP